MDPGFFFRGGGGSRPDRQHIFFFSFFKSSTYFTANGIISEKTILFQGSREGLTFFQGRSNFFQGGVQMLISIETHITCDFPGGGSGPPNPPSGSAHVSKIVFCDLSDGFLLTWNML